MMRRVLVIALLLVLIGCTTKWAYNCGPFDQLKFDNDYYECNRIGQVHAAQIYPAGSVIWGIEADRQLELCMQSRCWRKVP